MKNEATVLPYRLNGSVTWNMIDDSGRLQLRLPDGDHITFEDDGVEIAELLEHLAEGDKRALRSELSQELHALLMQRNVLVSREEAPSDWLEELAEYVLARSDRIKGPGNLVGKARAKPISIVGEGWLADIAREACAEADLNYADARQASEHDGPGFVLALSDRLAMDFFSQQNIQACERGVPIVFVWRELSQIVSGPLVIPGESACFECYRSRLRSNARHLAEFDALASYQLRRRDHLPSDLARGSVKAFLARQLLVIAAGAYDLFETNTIYSFDALQLQLNKHPILRIPRCGSCGAYRSEPMRAVRAIS